MSVYENAAVMALSMITDFGQTITLCNITPGTYDPATGTQTPELIEDQPASGILLDYIGFELQPGSLIQQGDKKLKVPAKGLVWAPTLQTKAVIQNKIWSVVNVKEINPAGVSILYELQIRS